MTDSSAKKVNSFIHPNSQELRSVFTKVDMLQGLHEKVAAYLDAGIKKYCQVANLIGNRLVIITANGSVATQLRFQTTDLIKQFKQNPALQHIEEIQCKVRPPQSSSEQRQHSKRLRKMEPLSPATAEIMREIAESLADPKLREVMERIAKRTKT